MPKLKINEVNPDEAWYLADEDGRVAMYRNLLGDFMWCDECGDYVEVEIRHYHKIEDEEAE